MSIFNPFEPQMEMVGIVDRRHKQYSGAADLYSKNKSLIFKRVFEVKSEVYMFKRHTLSKSGPFHKVGLTIDMPCPQNRQFKMKIMDPPLDEKSRK